MRRLIARTLSVAAGAMAGAAHAEEPSDPIAAVAEGEVILEARPRLETLDQQGVAEADAYTLRTRLGWETASWRGLSGLIEIEDVRDLGGDYSSPARALRQHRRPAEHGSEPPAAGLARK